MIMRLGEKMYWPDTYKKRADNKNPDRLLYRGFAALSEPKVKMVPGDDLLSHGETPHYHRR